MTPQEYIRKAQHCIHTNQPNLAMLYLRKGIEQTDRDMWHRAWEITGLHTRRIGMAFVEIGKQVSYASRIFA